jgi:nickel/cobalt exporter
MIRRSLAVLLLGLLGALTLSTPAQAHPLGNFTTNQYAGLRITGAGVDVDFVLDLAELPAYQARTGEIDTDRDGTGSPAEHTAYAERTCAAAAAAGTVTVGDRNLRLTAEPAGLTFPAGAAGLTTLRLQCVLHADARITAATTVGYRTTLYADRIGWREITAVGDRYTVTRSDVPADSVSARLTAYPNGVVSPDMRAATISVRPGGPAATAPFAAAGATPTRDVDRLTAWFTDLVGHPELTLGIGVLAFLIAVVLGGAHAVAPGHGKTIMAAYLVGSRGRLRQALTVAGAVAATHTVGVLVIGILLATSLQVAPDAMYGWLRLISGLLITLVGAHLLYQAIRRMRSHPAPHDHHHDHDHDHDHDQLVPAGHVPAHRHDQDHQHGHRLAHAPTTPHVHSHGGRPHTHHLPAPDEPLRIRTLLAMGFAGGLSPSPSAVVVLLGAAALGRAWYGVLLVLAYGIGLAATLTAIGFALAHWGERLHRAGSGRWSTLLTRRLPVATATVIVLVGLGVTLLATPGLQR